MKVVRSTRNAKSRRGAGFIILVVMLFLVISAATQMFLRGALQARKQTQQNVRISTLRNAIVAVAKQPVKPGHLAVDHPLVLPIDNDRQQSILVWAEGEQLIAVWRQGETELERLALAKNQH